MRNLRLQSLKLLQGHTARTGAGRLQSCAGGTLLTSPQAPPVLRPLLKGTLLESLIRLFSQIPCLCPMAPERVNPSREGPCRLPHFQCFLPPLHLPLPSPHPTKSTGQGSANGEKRAEPLCPTLSTDVDLPEVVCFQHPSHKAGYGVVTPQNAKLQGIPASIQPNSPIWLQKEASGSKSHSWLVMEPEWALDPSPAFIPLCQTMRGKCLGVRMGFLGPCPPPPTLPCSPTSMPGSLSMTDV